MHMAKVVLKLLNGDYADEGGMIADLRLMVDNCRRYVHMHIRSRFLRFCRHDPPRPPPPPHPTPSYRYHTRAFFLPAISRSVGTLSLWHN